MAINLAGALSGIGQEIETNTRAARMVIRPTDVGAQGSFRKSLLSGTVAAGAGTALVYGFRWAPTPTTLLCVPRRISVGIGCVTGFAAGFLSISAFFARPYTTLDSTGAGTSGTFTGNNAKMRTNMAASAGVTCAVVNTSALSGGSSTLDTDPFATWGSSVTTTGGQSVTGGMVDLFKSESNNWPLVFANLEGFQIKTTVPATGTWNIAVDVAWDEVSSFGAAILA